MNIHYLEVVTKNVEAMCRLYSHLYDVEFGETVMKLGGARTATMTGGGIIGIRAPMRDTEGPVVRSYWRVDDIQSAVVKAEKQGALIAMPPTEMEGMGQFAIFIQDGIEAGFWQV